MDEPPDETASLTHSATGNRLAAGLANGSVRVWDAVSGKVAWSAPAHEGRVTHVAFSPDGERLLTAAESGDSAVRVWDAATGRERHALRHRERVAAAAFSGDGGLVVTLGGDGRLRAWDADTGALVGSLPEGSGSSTTVVAAPGGGPFAVEFRGQLRVYDPVTLRREMFAWSAGTVADPPPATRVPAALPLRAVVETDNIPHILGQSADGRRLVTTTYLNDIHVWELPSGKRLHKFELPKEAMSLRALIDVPRLLDGRFQAALSPVALAGGRVDVIGSAVTVTLHPQGPDSLAAIKALAGLPEPVRLVLAGDAVPEAALANLAGARPVVSLKLGSASVRDGWLRRLAELPAVEELDLSGCSRLTDAGLEYLKGLKKLRRVNLRGTGATAAGRAGLKAARPDVELAD